MMIVIIAPGNTILKLTLNLSLIFVFCVLTAAIVVSEIIDRLSPNIAPPTTVAMANAAGTSVACANPKPTGAIAATVPTEVPIEIDTNIQIINSPTIIRF